MTKTNCLTWRTTPSPSAPPMLEGTKNFTARTLKSSLKHGKIKCSDAQESEKWGSKTGHSNKGTIRITDFTIAGCTTSEYGQKVCCLDNHQKEAFQFLLKQFVVCCCTLNNKSMSKNLLFFLQRLGRGLRTPHTLPQETGTQKTELASIHIDKYKIIQTLSQGEAVKLKKKHGKAKISQRKKDILQGGHMFNLFNLKKFHGTQGYISGRSVSINQKLFFFLFQV